MKYFLCSLVEVVCCDVMFHLTLLVESCFFVGLLFFGACGVLSNVPSRTVFSFFRRGSLDETVLRSAAA